MTETVWAKAVLVNRLDRIAVSTVPMICLRWGFLNMVLSAIVEERLPKNMSGASVPMVEPCVP